MKKKIKKNNAHIHIYDKVILMPNYSITYELDKGKVFFI